MCHKLQALVYDILSLEEGAGKRCSECGCVSVTFLGYPALHRVYPMLGERVACAAVSSHMYSHTDKKETTVLQ